MSIVLASTYTPPRRSMRTARATTQARPLFLCPPGAVLVYPYPERALHQTASLYVRTPPVATKLKHAAVVALDLSTNANSHLTLLSSSMTAMDVPSSSDERGNPYPSVARYVAVSGSNASRENRSHPTNASGRRTNVPRSVDSIRATRLLRPLLRPGSTANSVTLSVGCGKEATDSDDACLSASDSK